ncbi:hypothetical protein [Pasteurella atlantica]|uniref:hypothetical protein n=1 Tax=Pasteurellaceae TaxID=712 RepID=UPI00275C8637|nr:hypothetical protein [Pasteurella atlantica]MDP8098747.1 hypothetical protein [Pasteurella atlantica]MDP8106859.1 hypothetical protein [Pasteurella atlantica]MDP8116549.1 hypothetical protein [Pasteurella atlantica]
MVIKKSAIIEKFLLLLLFFVLFRFYFKWGVSVQKLAFFVFFLGYFLLNINVVYQAFIKLKKQIKIAISLFLLCYFFYFIVIFITPVIHQTYDLSYYARFVYFTLFAISGIDAFIFIEKNITTKNSYKVYTDAFIRITLIYIFFTYLFLFFPTFKDAWLSLVYQDDVQQRIMQEGTYVTRWGISGFSGFPYTILCTFALIFQITKINTTKINIKEFIILMLLFSGNVLYGRIGIVASFACLIAWILYSLVIFRKIKILLYFIVLLMLIVSGLVYLYLTSPEFAAMLNWAITPFLNLITTGEVNNYSANHLMNDMYFIPSDTTLMFGDGKYMVDGSYYMHTDAGFMRLMLYSGVLSQIFLYGGLLFLLYAVYKNQSQINKKNAFLMVMLFLGSFFVFEFKGEMFFQLISVIFPLALANMKLKEC